MDNYDDDLIIEREAELARHRENKGRQAGVFASYETTGYGAVEFEDPVEFGLTFIQRPWMSFGCEIEPDHIRDLLELADGDELPCMPQVTGYVTAWDLDDARNYVGAWVAVTVTWPTDTVPAIPIDAQIDVTHFFTFSAIGLKTIPVDE